MMDGLKLLNIVQSTMLLENRIDDAKRLVKKLGLEDSFNAIVELSSQINPNHKYLNFIASNFKEINQNPIKSLEIFRYFERNNSKFPKRDINQYADFNELEQTVFKVSNQKRREVAIVPGTQVLYEDDFFVVLIPETKQASCHYGLGTTWCTANSESSYYHEYRLNGELYYAISKTKPTSDPTYKMAVRVVFDSGDGQFPPVPKIAEIRNAQNNWLTEQELVDNSSSNVLTAIREDLHRKWEDWWNKLSETLKQKYKKESEKRAYELEREAERRRLANEREAAQRLARRNEQEARREAGEYDDDDEVHALRAYLIEVGEWDGGDPEEADRINNEINQVNEQITVLEAQLAEFPNNEEIYNQLTELRNRLDELNEELNQVTGTDIYDLYREDYDYYGLNVYTNEQNGHEYAIGTDDEAEEAARQQIAAFIDENRNTPGMGFNDGFIEHFIDGDRVAQEFEAVIEDTVRESPESYLDDDDKELTDEGQELLEEKREALNEVKERKWEIEDRISEIEAEMEDMEFDSEEYAELEKELFVLQSELEDLEAEISELESEIEDIEDGDEYKEYSEDAIERVIEDRLDEIRDNPVETLREWGITDWSPFIDEDELIDEVLQVDGRGNGLGAYDGEENEITYNGTTYYIYRIN